MSADSLFIVFLQTGIVLLVALLLCTAKAPHFKRTICRVAIAAVLVLSFGSPWLHERAHPLVPVQISDTQPLPDPQRYQPAVPAVIQKPATVAPEQGPSINLGEWVFGIWLLGVVVLTVRLALGCVSLFRLRRACRPASCSQADETLSEAAWLASVRKPDLLEGDLIPAPFVAGAFRPAVFVPTDWHNRAEHEVLRAVLRHEVAHIAHRDLIWQLVHQLTCILLWPQPLIWLLGRPMNSANESLCDRQVLSSGIEARHYARCLLQLKEELPKRAYPALGIGAVAYRSALGKRIEAILDARGSRRLTLTRSAIALAVVGAVVLGTCATCMFAHPTTDRQKLLRIRVVSPTGEPLNTGWASVESGNATEKPTMSDAAVRNGFVEIRYPQSASWAAVDVQAPGYGLGSTHFETKHPLIDPWTKSAPMIHLPKEAKLIGKLVLPDGAPGKGIRILPCSIEAPIKAYRMISPAMTTRLSCVTNEKGEFTIASLPEGCRILVSVQDSRFGVVDHYLEPNNSKKSVIALELAAAIEGRVTMNGKGVTGIHVNGSYSGTSSFGGEGYMTSWRTDVNGRFRLSNLIRGTYQLEPVMPPQLAGAFVFSPYQSFVKLKSGQVASHVDFKLEPGVVIQGTVTNRRGAPLVHAEVVILDPLINRRRAKTDEHGRYSLLGQPGVSRVVLDVPSNRAPAHNIDARAGSTVTADFRVDTDATQVGNYSVANSSLVSR